MTPEDDDFAVTEAELAEARVRHAAMQPCIPEIFASSLVGNGVRADCYLPDDDGPETPAAESAGGAE